MGGALHEREAPVFMPASKTGTQSVNVNACLALWHPKCILTCSAYCSASDGCPAPLHPKMETIGADTTRSSGESPATASFVGVSYFGPALRRLLVIIRAVSSGLTLTSQQLQFP